MASNYQNSAGTDLDDIFLIDNSNGGGVGLQIWDGSDIGNHYCCSATLGYGVGYQNSAGTDLGYLRGNIPAPSMWGQWANFKKDYARTQGGWYDSGDSGSEFDPYYYEVCGDINVGATTSMYGQWQMCFAVLHGANGYDLPKSVDWIYRDNSSSKSDMWKWPTARGTQTFNSVSQEGGWAWVYNGGCDQHPARTFAFGLTMTTSNRNDTRGFSLGLRIYQRFGNGAGWTNWWSKDFWFI